MIKLPVEMVVYPQSHHNPGYLLCWIPPKDYSKTAPDSAAQLELERFHPDGMEVVLTEDALGESGIELPVSVDALRQAYLGLQAAGALPVSGMIAASQLIGIENAGTASAGSPEAGIAEMPTGEKSLSDLADGPQRLESSFDPGMAGDWQAEPVEMVGDEDAVDVFDRLAGRRPGRRRAPGGGE